MAKNSKRNKTEMLNSSGSSGSGGSSSGSSGNDTILILNAIKESLEVLSKRGTEHIEVGKYVNRDEESN
jgi:hypothetical protein